MSVPDCSHCHVRPEIGSMYGIATGRTTYYVVCTRCGCKSQSDTKDGALEGWRGLNPEEDQ